MLCVCGFNLLCDVCVLVSGVLIGVRAADGAGRVARAVETNVYTANELHRENSTK